MGISFSRSWYGSSDCCKAVVQFALLHEAKCLARKKVEAAKAHIAEMHIPKLTSRVTRNNRLGINA